MSDDSAKPTGSTCPYCSASLPEEAQVCPSCRAWIDTTTAKSAAAPAAKPAAARLSLKSKIDIAASTREANRQTLILLTLVGVAVIVLIGLGLIVGSHWINLRAEQQAVARSTQTVIAQVRTATAQVVATRSMLATRQAEPTVFAMATQAQATADVRATQDAVPAAELLRMAALWTPVFTDTFDQVTGIWYTGEDEDDLMKGSWSIQDGQYQISLEAKDAFSQWMWPDPDPQVNDFYLGVRMDFVEGPDGMDGGLIFRRQEDGSFYLFDVTAGGDFAVYMYTGSEWVTISEASFTENFKAGGINLLEAVGEGDKYTLFINGQKVVSFRDDRLQQGGIGFLIGLASPGDKGAFTIDDVVVRSPTLY